MTVIVYLVVWLLAAAILLAIAREILKALGFAIADRIIYLLFLLIALILVFNALGFMGEPWTLGRFGRC